MAWPVCDRIISWPSNIQMRFLQGFIVRALVLPEEEYAHISVDTLNELVATWEKMFQDNYGLTNMIYNVHLFVSISDI